MKTTRIGLYYDGNYFFQASNFYAYGHHKRKRISISGLHEFVRQQVAAFEKAEPENCMVCDAHYFRVRPGASEASQRGDLLFWDRAFDDILSAAGVTTHYIPSKLGQDGQRAERDTDIWLALEAYQNARVMKLDYAVLLVGDADYLPLVSKLNSLGTKVILLGWEIEYTNENNNRIHAKASQELMDAVNYPLEMNKIIDDFKYPLADYVSGLFVSNEPKKPVKREEESADPGEDKIGTILNLRNGFGFIKYPPNNVFFHFSNVMNCDFQDLHSGDTVVFDLEKSDEGQDIAKNVRLAGALEFN